MDHYYNQRTMALIQFILSSLLRLREWLLFKQFKKDLAWKLKSLNYIIWVSQQNTIGIYRSPVLCSTAHWAVHQNVYVHVSQSLSAQFTRKGWAGLSIWATRLLYPRDLTYPPRVGRFSLSYNIPWLHRVDLLHLGCSSLCSQPG